MELKNFVNEIIDIAKVNHMAWDIGKDMFIANIRNAGMDGVPYYAGANVDYAALHAAWMSMSMEEQAEAKNEFDRWYRGHMEEVIAARKDGGRFECHE